MRPIVLTVFNLLRLSGNYITRFSLCVLCVSLVGFVGTTTTETQSAESPRFTEISSQAGIDFKHVYSPEKKYIAESMSGGVALFDYDNDGYLDVYFVNSLTIDLARSHQKTRSALYRNNGNNTFTDVTEDRK